MIYSDAGLKFTESFEGCKLVAYLDQGGIPTLGIGHTLNVGMGDRCMEDQAYKWLREDMAEAESAVNRLVKVPLTQNQYDSLCDMVFNIGAGNFEKSTLLRLLNKRDYKNAAEEFVRWNRAGGFVRAGLTRRRLAEKELFLKGMV